MRKLLAVMGVATLGLMVGVALAYSGGYAQAQVEAVITISPQTLVLSSKCATWVTVHTNLPYSSVESASVSLDDIPIAWSKVDSRGFFVAKFQMGEVKAIAVPPSVELTLAGVLTDGQTFSGTDTVPVNP